MVEIISLSRYLNRRMIWKTNLHMVEKHNLKAELGGHSYTLKMNQFGDMVSSSCRLAIQRKYLLVSIDK